MDRHQVNVRLTQEQVDALEQLRIELQPQFGKIPTRSEVIRYALDYFLANGTGGPTGSGPAKKSA